MISSSASRAEGDRNKLLEEAIRRFRLDYEAFAEHCIKIGDKLTGDIVPFRMNRAQRKLHLKCEDMLDRATTINPAPVIHRFDVWFPTDPRQRVLWPSEVVLRICRTL